MPRSRALSIQIVKRSMVVPPHKVPRDEWFIDVSVGGLPWRSEGPFLTEVTMFDALTYLGTTLQMEQDAPQTRELLKVPT
jgi:hypothetical protein